MTPESTKPGPGRAVEATAVVLLCFGWFIYGSLVSMANGFPAGRAAGAVFTDASFVQLMLIELVLGGVALFFLRSRGHVLADLLPRPSWRGGLAGVLLFFAAMVMWMVLAAFFTPQDHAAQPVAQMVSRPDVSIGIVVLMSLLNGVYEETFLLGYLVRQFEDRGASFAIGLSVLVRLLYHLYQGPIGALSVCLWGVLAAVCYWRTRALWAVAFAHMLVDVYAFS